MARVAKKKDLHALVDALPASEVAAARRYLEYLRDLGDPVLQALQRAPLDDEPETAEEAALVAEAKKGRVISHAEAKRRLGL